MQVVKKRNSTDILSLVSVISIAVFVSILFVVAATNPGAHNLLTMVTVGLGAGGLILFRQLRKAANSLITSEARAQYAATHDECTQLPNKALFMDRLNTATPGVGVICVGLDRFEEVNEVLGFGASDELIVEIAARLTSICRDHDTIARLGDDNFALLWTGATRRKAEALANQMIKLLSAPYEASAGQTFVTGSIGIGFLTSDMDKPVEALRQAQLALSNAKKRGGAHFSVYEPAMDQALKSRKALEVDLRRALADGVLHMLYQPQVNAKGVMVGVEALMRWTHPERGPVSPAMFVPLAESCGLSDALGRLALKQAFKDSLAWSGLKVAVNVSAAQVRSGSLIPTLRELVSQAGVNPRNFELEITEGVLLADETETFEVLNGIRRMGFSLALDDFGTGYSSLSYLRRFPIDKIKIDKSFVAHLGQRPESDAIVKAIVDLAEALELNVIAEGVETKAQVDRLAIAGCTNIQGYFYSEAVDASIISDMLAGRSKLAA